MADLMNINTAYSATNAYDAITPAGDYNGWSCWPTVYPQPTYVYPWTSITYLQPTPARCAWCQGQHTGKCDDLKAVVYRKDGTVERVEFFGKDDDHD